MAGFADRYGRVGDLMEEIDDVTHDITSLLDLAEKQERAARG